jgi:hypothetical protein
MTITDINDFKQERDCTYKGERYSVRDNGAVMRHKPENGRLRQNDNKWTFGKPNFKTRYMEIASERIHRIVAIAFLGEPPTSEYVVDHVDTNRRNNRPENLRWVTKLEYRLLDPVTANNVILACGSIETYLNNPSILPENNPDPNFKWMRDISIQEAKNSLKRMREWAKKDYPSSTCSIGEWTFERTPPEYKPKKMLQEFSLLKMAKTPKAAQRNWSIPSEFPCCPQENGSDPLFIYAENIKIGTIFVCNNIYKMNVLKYALSDNHQKLWVMSENSDEKAVKPWALAEITYENNLYVHTNRHSYFTLEGAEKQFCLAQGLKWTGGDSIDDYC